MGCVETSEDLHRLSKLKTQRSCYYSLFTANDEIYIDTGNQKVKYEVKWNQDFLQHHLANETPLTPHTSSHKIRARQVIQHYIFKDALRNKHSGMLSPSKLTEFALRAWFQRTFASLLEKAERNYFEEGKPYNEVKQQLAEEYVFEVYQMGSFLNAGFGKYSTAQNHVQISLAPLLLSSDSAFYFILEELQEKYPLVSNDENLTFPQVEELKTNLNLLTLIDSKCYADLDHYNFQTTLDDLKTLIDEANRNYQDFKTDMRDMLGSVETDCKVKWQAQGDQTVYNASAVRRVFIKWSQTMIQRVPEVCGSKQFMEFVRSKKEMADQFIFKGTVSPTTHQQVIDKLSELLESIKCHPGTKTPREQFGLFLYDLLRSKTKRKTPQQIVQLLSKLKSITMTSTGKRFEVIRVKNRFKKSTRDLLVNFRYGEHLVGEVQLCVDDADSSPKISKQIKFRHMIYELERGLFGPTFEMIMQYEDESRKDIIVKMQAQGEMKLRRVVGESASLMKQAGRKCPQNHEMIAIMGDIFSEDRLPDFMQEGQGQGICDFCFMKFSVQKEYHYCYYCSIFYCLRCINAYKATDRTKMKLSCLDHSLIPSIDSPENLQSLCQANKSIIMIAIKPRSIQSQLFIDQIVYLLKGYISHQKKLPLIYSLDVSEEGTQTIIDRYHIARTPTMIVLDQQQKMQVTLVGCTYFDVEQIFQVSTRIASCLPKGLKIKCIECQEPMTEGSSRSKCQVCMGTNKVQTLTDFIENLESSGSDFVCSSGHLRCQYCSYLSSNSPSCYTDYTGRSYLSSKICRKVLHCKRGHVMELIPIKPQSQYPCSRCNKQVKENDLNTEVGFCFQCTEFACLHCEDSSRMNFLQRKAKELFNYVEVVSHFARNKLEQGYPCGCGKYFWRVYQSQKIDHKKFRLMEFLGIGGVAWHCYLCNKEQTDLKLHLACFYCKYAEALNGQPSHTEICLSCAMKSGLLGRPSQQSVHKSSTNLKCDSEHPILITCSRDEASLYFSCLYCKKSYHPYTERYSCQLCEINICIGCGQDNLRDMVVLTSTKRCDQNHELVIDRKSPKLQFCRICSLYLQDSHFRCTGKECSYHLCIDCAMQIKEA